MVARDRAWTSLVSLLDVRAGQLVATPAQTAAAAELVADFVKTHPGALEEAAGDQLHALFGDGFGRPAALFGALGPDEDDRPYAAALRALSPDGLVRAFATLWRRDPRIGERVSGRALQSLARRAAPSTLAALTLPPEAYDALHALAGLAPLPDILPRDLAGRSRAEVESLLSIYTGLPIADLEARLRGVRHRDAFLAEGESVAEVILRDARWLADRGIDRHQLAHALAARFDQQAPALAPGAAGHEWDPFHTIDLYPVHGRGAAELRHGWPRKRSIPSLAVETIRRACFFEGDVPYRVEPARLLRFLRG